MAAVAEGTLPEQRYAFAVIAAIFVLVGIRLVCAAVTPLSFDECLYWLWSQYLAGGYNDHPPLNPFLIRLGTTLFGSTQFGVRVCNVLLALPATWALWRAAAILFKDARVAATAALYFNLTLVMAIGSVLSTPDNAVVAATAFLLLTLCKLYATGRGEWWLAIGVTFGVGMLSKYTTIFFAPGILAWLLWVPEQRKWLATPWPWISGVIAVVVFSPTLIWNAEHHWATVVYQSNRLVVHEWTLRYLGELIVAQIGLATPPIFILGCMGVAALIRGEGGSQGARALINAMIWPIVIYFAWHALHERVQGNWPEPMFIGLMIAAGVAAEKVEWKGAWLPVAVWSRRLAVPFGLALAAVVYAQAVFAIVPLGSVDPTARDLGAGWKELGVQMDALRNRIGAPVVLTWNYGLNAWLAFYLPSRPPVEQITDRIRYVNAPEPNPALFDGPIMFVCTDACGEVPLVRKRFQSMEQIAELSRSRRGVPIQHYTVYKLTGPIGPPLDPP